MARNEAFTSCSSQLGSRTGAMVVTTEGDEAAIKRLHTKLQNGNLSLPQKYRILFSLRNCSNASALNALLLALKDDSALLRHDVAFALGQRQDTAAIQALKGLLEDPNEHCMVRHEAAEALGAIGTPECLRPVACQVASPVPEVAETCLLAQQRIQYFAGATGAEQSKFGSVDPTPPFPTATPAATLSETLLSSTSSLFDKYRALFALRDQGGDAAVDAMAACLRTSRSTLLKHEVAYVLGQLLDKRGLACLRATLQVQPPPYLPRQMSGWLPVLTRSLLKRGVR